MERVFVHLGSCDGDLLLQLVDALHVPHVVKIFQTGLDIIHLQTDNIGDHHNANGFHHQYQCENLVIPLEHLEHVRGDAGGHCTPQHLHPCVRGLKHFKVLLWNQIIV